MRNFIVSGVVVGISALLCAIPACWNDEPDDPAAERRGHGDPCDGSNNHGHGHGSGCVPPSTTDAGPGSDFPIDAPEFPTPSLDAGSLDGGFPPPQGPDAGFPPPQGPDAGPVLPPCHGRHCGGY